MKIQTPAATLLLTVMAGVSHTYAQGPINSATDSVPVTIQGTVEAPNVAGCSVSTENSGLTVVAAQEGEAWKKESGSGPDGEYYMNQTNAGSISIDCDANANLTIKFATNNQFSQEANDTTYGSWPVVIIPTSSVNNGGEYLWGDEGFQDAPSEETYEYPESRVNGYLVDANCDTNNTCKASGSNLNSASIEVNTTTADTINASINAALYAPAEYYGSVHPSPRAPAPRLYVIYEATP